MIGTTKNKAGVSFKFSPYFIAVHAFLFRKMEDESNRWKLPEDTSESPFTKTESIMNNFLDLRHSLNSFNVPGAFLLINDRKKTRQLHRIRNIRCKTSAASHYQE
jgi:hypothetical protein